MCVKSNIMFLYRTKFDNIVTASLNFDNNVLLSQASLDSLKSIIPSSVNLEKNVDLVGAAFNGAVVNRFNKNGDGIASYRCWYRILCSVQHMLKRLILTSHK